MKSLRNGGGPMIAFRKNVWFWLGAAGILAAMVVSFERTTPAGQVASQLSEQLPNQSKEEQRLILSLDGAELFRTHCAVCHGKDATGAGPAASALRKKVPDLTKISQRHRGEFPLAEVQLTISGDVVPSPAHGSREMPIWGPIFSQIAWDQD